MLPIQQGVNRLSYLPDLAICAPNPCLRQCETICDAVRELEGRAITLTRNQQVKSPYCAQYVRVFRTVLLRPQHRRNLALAAFPS
jgi:hypothetical protein